ncbi:hypothetical protein DPMN_121305 [Dreissena polymorpha]|uniref:Uncharacterized protein n=1 Tax=Dreissena polymorpha TaxID=45954 RepID=A0A9D4GQA2_DREPO|nr:hypothetical protein DPMN_121305 [Dreissena polymorpha]
MFSPRYLSPSPGGHVFQQTGSIFELIPDIIKTNVLTMFHDDWTLNRKNSPPPGGHVFQPTNIIGTNLLTMLHIIRQQMWTLEKNAPPPGSEVFQATPTIFELVHDIIGTILLTKFHDDRTINVATRVLTRKNALQADGHVFWPTRTIFKHVHDIIDTYLLNKFQED